MNVLFFIICSVDSNNSITPMDTNMSQFDAYWNRCKMQKLYIVGNTECICQKRSMTIWTGLRKYDIGIHIKHTDYTCTYRFVFFCQKILLKLINIKVLKCNSFYLESVRSNQTCYSIERNETIIGYRERNCTESLPFICKHHTGELTYLFACFIFCLVICIISNKL